MHMFPEAVATAEDLVNRKGKMYLHISVLSLVDVYREGDRKHL